MDNSKEQQILTGILPKHLAMDRLRKVLLYGGIFFIVLSIMMFIAHITGKLLVVTGLVIYQRAMIFLFLIGIISFVLMGIVYFLFLRKCKFDDWMLEIAHKYLGTQVIFYTNKRLLIQYDRNGREVDKREFVTRLSDLSEHYTYFFVKTYIDIGFIEVVVTEKQPVPEVAPFTYDDTRKDWNNIQLGLAVNTSTLKVAPLCWKLNDNIKDKKIINTIPSTSLMVCGGTGGGKSVTENGIVAHISHNSDHLMMIGVDMKKVEFNLLQGVKGVVGVALEIDEARDAFVSFYTIMDRRYKFMASAGVNNIYDIKKLQVNYYNLFGREYQFDEIFCVWQDLDKTARDYEKQLKIHKDGRCQTFMTIEEIYDGLKEGTLRNPKLVEYRGYNSYIKDGDIKKTTGEFKVKAMILLVDELNALMSSDDYRALEDIKTALGQILRLGRAAGVHVCLAMQRAGAGTINQDQMNNIQQRIILGGFDDGASQLLFNKDISGQAKPSIKGRGFCQSGNEIYETQFFYFKQARDFMFDEDRIDSYRNKIFRQQKYGEEDAEVPESDLAGFVEQIPNEYEQPDPQEDEDFMGMDYYPPRNRQTRNNPTKRKSFENNFVFEEPKKEEVEEEIKEEENSIDIPTSESSNTEVSNKDKPLFIFKI